MFFQNESGAADAYLDGGKGCALNDWRFDRRADALLCFAQISESGL